ncbi:Cytosolic sulfotransferase 15 [Raphanus sativus]|uniref:Sulfotransferase n=1 Tax=Raphanus sativus TaxID=3726 RepID=A0A6J0N7W0_RAPSA|nr:cytosolic sulfotransferase 15-like [Raphanus sativus]KAJ4903972.1 Cytosolic sulfotransferase 15 [Raphanus sativus]
MDTPQQQEDRFSPPEAKWWVDGKRIRHKGFWFKPEFITASEAIREHYTPLPSDIILASFPKTGTTWLKALTSSILRHSSNIRDDNHDHLDNLNPHEVVPFLEIELFGENPSKDITKISSPRVFNTHLPLSFLPETLKTSGSKVIYITRHPADTFVSLWHLYNNKFGTEISIREAFDDFCKDLVPAGPYFDHVLEFWEARDRDRVLFITYEDLKVYIH